MIKELIRDIAFDNIKLSQGLTRAKLIENRVKNETFKGWLNKELEGYDFDDALLPSYRKVWAPVKLVAEFPYGRTETFPVNLPDRFGQKTLDMINNHRIIEPIAIVENQIEILVDKSKGYINLPAQQVEILADLYKDQIGAYGGVIRYGNREIGRVMYQNVLELTKQKLLDTLMQLNDEFPDLVNEYKMTDENKERVQNIVTNNIYGHNNPMNIATGVNVEMNINNTISKQDEERLHSYGVTPEQIGEIKQIVQDGTKDKADKTSKLMKWLGSVTASVAGRGLYESIPQITDFVHKLIP